MPLQKERSCRRRFFRRLSQSFSPGVRHHCVQLRCAHGQRASARRRARLPWVPWFATPRRRATQDLDVPLGPAGDGESEATRPASQWWGRPQLPEPVALESRRGRQGKRPLERGLESRSDIEPTRRLNGRITATASFEDLVGRRLARVPADEAPHACRGIRQASCPASRASMGRTMLVAKNACPGSRGAGRRAERRRQTGR